LPKTTIAIFTIPKIHMAQDKYFVDTGAYFALFYVRDKYHPDAQGVWSSVEKQKIPIVTTNHVLDELATLLARRTTYEFAARKLTEIFSSRLEIIRPTADEEQLALEYFKKYSDQKVSFTDCLSFAAMRKNNIEQSFTFDQHFQYAGFKIVPVPGKK
jgi:uncharacterized protein